MPFDFLFHDLKEEVILDYYYGRCNLFSLMVLYTLWVWSCFIPSTEEIESALHDQCFYLRMTLFHFLHLDIQISMCVCRGLGGTKEEVALKSWKSKGGWKSASLHCCPVSPCCCRLAFMQRYFNRYKSFSSFSSCKSSFCTESCPM
jgi:hypothetical protein